MSTLVLVLAVAAWVAATVGFLLVVTAWFGVVRLAPSGEKVAAALDLGFFNFASVERRLGEKAGPFVRSFRKGATLFFICVSAFVALTLVNIVSGNAA